MKSFMADWTRKLPASTKNSVTEPEESTIDQNINSDLDAELENSDSDIDLK